MAAWIHQTLSNFKLAPFVVTKIAVGCARLTGSYNNGPAKMRMLGGCVRPLVDNVANDFAGVQNFSTSNHFDVVCEPL